MVHGTSCGGFMVRIYSAGWIQNGVGIVYYDGTLEVTRLVSWFGDEQAKTLGYSSSSLIVRRVLRNGRVLVWIKNFHYFENCVLTNSWTR
jgi:hypothetical protein